MLPTFSRLVTINGILTYYLGETHNVAAFINIAVFKHKLLNTATGKLACMKIKVILSWLVVPAHPFAKGWRGSFVFPAGSPSAVSIWTEGLVVLCLKHFLG